MWNSLFLNLLRLLDTTHKHNYKKSPSCWFCLYISGLSVPPHIFAFFLQVVAMSFQLRAKQSWFSGLSIMPSFVWSCDCLNNFAYAQLVDLDPICSFPFTGIITSISLTFQMQCWRRMWGPVSTKHFTICSNIPSCTWHIELDPFALAAHLQRWHWRASCRLQVLFFLDALAYTVYML
jgi:hypothetical protein